MEDKTKTEESKCQVGFCPGKERCFVLSTANAQGLSKDSRFFQMRAGLECVLSDDELREKIEDPDIAKRFIKLRRK